jgi:hypothetical protein
MERRRVMLVGNDQRGNSKEKERKERGKTETRETDRDRQRERERQESKLVSFKPPEWRPSLNHSEETTEWLIVGT